MITMFRFWLLRKIAGDYCVIGNAYASAFPMSYSKKRHAFIWNSTLRSTGWKDAKSPGYINHSYYDFSPPDVEDYFSAWQDKMNKLF